MALPTFSQASASTTGTTGTTSHSIVGASISAVTDGIGIFCLERNDGVTTDLLTGVTWGGNAMTAVVAGGIVNTTSNTRFYMYYITAPVTGTVTITATSSSNINTRIWWYTIQGAAQQAPQATNSLFTGSSTTLTPSVTTTSNESLVVGGGVVRLNSNVPTAQAGSTIRMNDSNAWESWTSPQATIGSNTSGVTGLTAASSVVGIVASFATATPANNAGFFMFM